MMVEGDRTIRDIDMIARKTRARNYPFGIKASERRLLKKDACEYVASTISEEHSIRQRPSAHRVSFYIWLHFIHAARLIFGAEYERHFWPQSGPGCHD